jgi:hypothetical protein
MKRRLSALAFLVVCLVALGFTPSASSPRAAPECYTSGGYIVCCTADGTCYIVYRKDVA